MNYSYVHANLLDIANFYLFEGMGKNSQYKKTLHFFRKSDICSIFSVGLPVTATILALPLSDGMAPYTPLHLGVGTLIGAVSALAAREMIDKKKTVASYLVDSERLSRTPSWLLHRKFEEFIND
ncbi:hypothetical protein [Methylomicrobium sp. Wu6]|uniref:hypothetical protein n=1 Tax=Methylomicrobium sp. Wu6 TaxID=3107928 RepID=UPI002DD6756F|nr:hypothetical protein [Methylomicrobium sp. Wu6]MEC4748562.1 hypothetical protein [Methylomicrobium sp. Wu6]